MSLVEPLDDAPRVILDNWLIQSVAYESFCKIWSGTELKILGYDPSVEVLKCLPNELCCFWLACASFSVSLACLNSISLRLG
jgi:hypothetical protein